MVLLAVLALLMGLGFTATDSTLIVKVNEPDSEVQVLDEKGKVELSRRTDSKGTITITVDPGRHRLTVRKNGFGLFTKDFEMESGGKKTISAKLVRAKEKITPKWRKQVAELPADKQVEAVLKKLKELNPGFDGKVTHKIENGVVVELEFVTDDLTDISAIRVFADLTVLKCAGSSDGTGKVSDLTPLTGMPLTGLNCRCNPTLADLTPLKGMPLSGLSCDKTAVSDLTPLKGMKLGYFSLGDTPVADLSPLTGMPLGELLCDNTRVSELSPLKGMTLESLSVSGSQVSSLLPLKDLRLTGLNCSKTQVADLAPLKRMPLSLLNCQATQVSDFSALADMPLKILWLDYKPKRDMEILRSIKSLETINDKAAADFIKYEGQ
jgi:hypothetical protein